MGHLDPFAQLRRQAGPVPAALPVPKGCCFVAVTKTYGGHRTDEQYEAIARVINEGCEGSITKVEDAALNISRRR